MKALVGKHLLYTTFSRAWYIYNENSTQYLHSDNKWHPQIYYYTTQKKAQDIADEWNQTQATEQVNQPISHDELVKMVKEHKRSINDIAGILDNMNTAMEIIVNKLEKIEQKLKHLSKMLPDD